MRAACHLPSPHHHGLTTAVHVWPPPPRTATAAPRTSGPPRRAGTRPQVPQFGRTPRAGRYLGPCLPLHARIMLHAVQPACLSVPATLYMLLTDPPACRPTDRTTHVPTHLSTGHSLLDPPHTHTHTLHPAAEAGSQKAEERPRKTWEADGAGLHGVRLLRGR